MIYNLHGNLGSASDWDGFPGEAVDLWAKSDLPYWEWALDFCADVKAKKEESNFLVGYSLGGRLALHALIAEPELWDGAVIIGAHPGLCCVEDRTARRSSDAVWAGWARRWEWEAFLEKWNAQGVLRDGKPSENQFELGARRKEIARGFENWSLGAQDDLRERLKNVTARVLWITGELDAKFSVLGTEMAEKMPNCELVVVEDSGHRVIFDQPKLLRDIIQGFTTA